MRGRIFLASTSCGLDSTTLRTPLPSSSLPPPHDTKRKENGWSSQHAAQNADRTSRSSNKSSNSSPPFTKYGGAYPTVSVCICAYLCVTRLPHRWYPSTLPRALRYHLVRCRLIRAILLRGCALRPAPFSFFPPQRLKPVQKLPVRRHAMSLRACIPGVPSSRLGSGRSSRRHSVAPPLGATPRRCGAIRMLCYGLSMDLAD
jgi:hypothetical protein